MQRASKSAIVRDALLRTLSAAPPAETYGARKPSIHDRLGKYQGAGATGIKDLASHPKHLAGYGR